MANAVKFVKDYEKAQEADVTYDLVKGYLEAGDQFYRIQETLNLPEGWARKQVVALEKAIQKATGKSYDFSRF